MQDRLSDTARGAVQDASAGAQGWIDQQLASVMASWTTRQRLYHLEGEGELGQLMVERFSLSDTLGEPFHLQLHTLALHTRLDLHAALGRRVSLRTRLADGSESFRTGLVTAARGAGADGGLMRYRLTVQPWTALLQHSRTSRVWQDKTVVQILDDVLGNAAYASHAAWRWGEAGEDGGAEDIAAFLAQGPHGGVRPYCVQYRETDLHFLQRLLAEEGLGWRVEETDDAPSGHRIVFFADSARWPENPTSLAPLGGRGIRFHRASAAEEQDAVQSFGGWRRLVPASSTVLRWDHSAKRAVAATAAGAYGFASESLQDTAPWLQDHDPHGAVNETGPSGAGCTLAELQHRATCRQQAFEARQKTWLARSSVRSLRAGQWFALTGSPLDALSELQGEADREFAVQSVQAIGINNLPKELSDRLMKQPQHDPFADLTGDASNDSLLDALSQDPELAKQAAALGYANRFEALRRQIPWRPLPATRPTALGMQTAIVVGPDGGTSAQGADELYADRLGRVRLQWHWQSAAGADGRPDNRNTCWVRVAQRWAGGGIGQQYLPRIGQEVLVDFIAGDVERPVVLGSLHNGRGDAGLPPTPGGAEAELDTAAYANSHDHAPSAQGNLTGGNAPAWHGGAPGDATAQAKAQNNAAALSGFKSKEFGGAGFSQLVFDDTPEQLRVQLATSQHATQLNLGHLVHQADNHRGSFRGRGFELRTDAFGAVRASQGLLITSYGIGEATPAGDNAAGMALLKQALTMSESFGKTAKTHEATALAGSLGTVKASRSALSEDASPIKALHTAASGMVKAATLDDAAADAGKRTVQASPDRVPHTADPIVAITAKAGLATVAGQDLQFASGDAITVQAGRDIQLAGGTHLHLHTGQSLGVLAGAVKAGQGAKGTGLTAIAGKGPVQVQAQAGQAQVAAKGLVNVQSANAHIDWAAAKKITLTTSGGAQVVIEAGGITVQGPGKILVKAATKSFVGGSSESYGLPTLPKQVCVECLLNAAAAGSPFAMAG